MTAFAPIGGQTQTLSVTATVSETTNPVNPDTTLQRQVRVASPSTNAVAFVRFGESSESEASATADLPILPGSIESFTVPPGAYMSAICASGNTATLYVTPGMGE